MKSTKSQILDLSNDNWRISLADGKTTPEWKTNLSWVSVFLNFSVPSPTKCIFSEISWYEFSSIISAWVLLTCWWLCRKMQSGFKQRKSYFLGRHQISFGKGNEFSQFRKISKKRLCRCSLFWTLLFERFYDDSFEEIIIIFVFKNSI